jgi:23S rRNA pseudouridine1911/1915/1917 synthase
LNTLGHPLFNENDGGHFEKELPLPNTSNLSIIALRRWRQALHAKTLGFVHPTTKEMMRFDTELPQIFRIVSKNGGYSKS